MRVNVPRDSFIRDLFAFGATTSPATLGRLLAYGAFAALVCGNDWTGHHTPAQEVGLAPYEVGGAILGLLLVLRTNAGYERWWEGRRLWGGIINRCRHLAVLTLTYGPEDPAWRRRTIGLTVGFAHAARRSLRGEAEAPELESLLRPGEAALVQSGRHLPNFVAFLLSAQFAGALKGSAIDRLAALQADSDLSALLDHLGGCERIRKTPLPRAYSVLIRQFLVVFLVTLPVGLLKKVGDLTPLVSVLIAYPLLVLDEVGILLQSPFAGGTRCSLPLDEACRTIEGDLEGLLSADAARREALPG